MIEWWLVLVALSVPAGGLIGWLWIRSMQRDLEARVERCREKEKQP